MRVDSSARAGADLLERALLLGHDAAPGTVGCSVTEMVGVAYRTSAASTASALALDQAQYADAAGPCVSAARDRQPQRGDVATEQARFPAFIAAARRRGVRSSLSVPVPVPVAGAVRPTALNFYSTQRSAFCSDRALGVAALLARMIGAMSSPAGGRLDGDVQVAEASGARVRSAVDVVMRRSGVDRAEAFAALVARSRTRGVGMRVVADGIMAGDDR